MSEPVEIKPARGRLDHLVGIENKTHILTNEQVEFVQSIPTAIELVLTFNKLHKEGRVIKSAWSAWQKVWSERKNEKS